MRTDEKQREEKKSAKTRRYKQKRQKKEDQNKTGVVTSGIRILNWQRINGSPKPSLFRRPWTSHVSSQSGLSLVTLTSPTIRCVVDVDVDFYVYVVCVCGACVHSRDNQYHLCHWTCQPWRSGNTPMLSWRRSSSILTQTWQE